MAQNGLNSSSFKDKCTKFETMYLDSYSQDISAILTTLSLLMMLVILIGNCVTIIAVVRYSALRTSTNIMVASLAVVDLMVGSLFHWRSSGRSYIVLDRVNYSV